MEHILEIFSLVVLVVSFESLNLEVFTFKSHDNSFICIMVFGKTNFNFLWPTFYVNKPSQVESSSKDGTILSRS